jgi:two-component system LytT family sensor kinase
VNIFKHLNYQRIGRHLLFWMAYIAYQAVNDGWENKDTLSFNLPVEFLTDVPVCIVLAYVNLYLLMPVYYNHRKYVAYITGLLVLLLIGGLLERYFSYLIWVPHDRLSDPHTYVTEVKIFWVPVRILRNTAEIFPVLAAAMLIKLMHASYRHQQALRALEQAKFTAEMGLLKAQLNPHFFFNTLNSLYALTLPHSKKATDVVLKLAALMDYMLYEASSNKVPLKNEIIHLGNYISIEQIRFADRLELSFQHSGDIEGKLIAPLLLLPFIENAFKHGIEDSPGWITINLKVTGNRLFLKVENSYLPGSRVKEGGIGLENVKKRLGLIYPGNFELNISESNEIFEIDLKLNL